MAVRFEARQGADMKEVKQPSPDDILLGRDVEQQYKISRQTIYDLVHTGKLKFYVMDARGTFGFRRRDIEALIETFAYRPRPQRRRRSQPRVTVSL